MGIPEDFSLDDVDGPKTAVTVPSSAVEDARKITMEACRLFGNNWEMVKERCTEANARLQELHGRYIPSSDSRYLLKLITELQAAADKCSKVHLAKIALMRAKTAINSMHADQETWKKSIAPYADTFKDESFSLSADLQKLLEQDIVAEWTKMVNTVTNALYELLGEEE